MGTPGERAANWLVWVALVVAVGSGVYAHLRVRALEAELAARPPIAVIDMSRIASEAAPGATLEDLNGRVTRARSAVERLAGAGYVVLERSQVEGYPVSLEVRP